MRQFARCTNCQQWYLHTYTTSVEIYEHDRLSALAVWCLGCIAAAEQRSQPRPEDPERLDNTVGSPLTYAHPSPATASDLLQALTQEHLQLMDRALYDDEAVLIPIVQAFIERCQLCQPTLPSPEQEQRLSGHVHYWHTFLQALKAAS